MGLDDLVPVLVVVGAVAAVGIYNVLVKARPGRRGRPDRPKPTNGSSSA